MSGLAILGIAIIVLAGAYLLYGRYLAKHGVLIPKQKHQLMKKKMVSILYQAINGRYLHISSQVLQVQVQ